MPTAQTITLSIEAGAKVLTLVPKSVNPIGVFQDNSATTILGRPELTTQHRLANSKVAGRTKLKLKVPVEATIDGVVQVVRENIVLIDVITSPDSTATERNDLMEYTAALLANADIVSMVENGEQMR